MWVAGIFAFVAGTANASNHGLQACLRGLQACMCGSQASQALQITGAGMPARLEFSNFKRGTGRGAGERVGGVQHCIHDMSLNGGGGVKLSKYCH